MDEKRRREDWSGAGCACKHWDARECLIARHGLPRAFWDDPRRRDERCECACHREKGEEGEG